MIPIAKPLLGEEENKAVLDVLSSGMLAQGERVSAFEKAFAQYIGVQHAIATSNGTTALHAALVGLGIGPGDEVITTTFSFIATANAIRMTGAVPVFVDIDEKTFNIDPLKVEAAITPKTRAIMPVHLFGFPAAMDALHTLARNHNLILIEDACQAHGAVFQKKKVGSFGVGCFSFYPTKNMTTGEGGMITVNDDALAALLRRIISHGTEKKYVHSMLGYNYRMTDIAAAIGLEQLKKLEHFNAARRRNASLLIKGLSSLPGLQLPAHHDGHVFHQFTIRVTKDFPLSREKVIDYLTENGIGSSVFYPIPIHQQEAYHEYNHQALPVAERIAREVMSLPVHPSITENDIQKIVSLFQAMGRENA